MINITYFSRLPYQHIGYNKNTVCCVNTHLCSHFLLVLNLHELVPTVTGDEEQHVGSAIGDEALGSRSPRWMPTGQNPHDVVYCYLIAPVVDFYVVSVQIQRVQLVIVHLQPVNNFYKLTLFGIL